MSNTVIDIKTFVPQKGQKFLLDCNVLMYVFYTFGNYKTSVLTAYKRFFNKIAQQKKCIIITSMLVSEFTNTYIRNEYKRYLKMNHLNRKNCDFKQKYKNTQEYHDTIEEIEDIICNQLLTLPSVILQNDEFETMNLSTMFSNAASFDFNDRYYAQLSKKKGLLYCF